MIGCLIVSKFSRFQGKYVKEKEDNITDWAAPKNQNWFICFMRYLKIIHFVLKMI